MFPCFERGFRESEMGVRCCGYDDYGEGGISEEFFRRVVDFGVGMIFGGVIVELRGSLNDGGEVEGGRYSYEGNMEDFGGQAGGGGVSMLRLGKEG